MRRIAIIGTRNPTPQQVDFLIKFVSKLPIDSEIISGCADGVDSMALQLGKEAGFPTIGVVPWRKYNQHVQVHCSKVISDRDVSTEDKEAARASVFKYHPAPDQCSDGAILLHSRNYLIVYKADLVLALPKNMSGGTMQGIRICIDLGISIGVVKDNGAVALLEEYANA